MNMAAKIFLNLPGGLKMPAVGLGTWQATDESELEKALEAALELGYRHIDTAYVYRNEAVIGRVLQKWLSSGKLKREELFITTKLPMYGVHPDRVDHFMKRSLKNLQLDYVDLYLIHFPVCFKYAGDDAPQPPLKVTQGGEYEFEPVTDHVAVWKRMEKQVDAGRAKSIGLSNFNVRQISNVLKSARIKPANLQVEIHVYLQQRELVDFCKKNGITIVAYSPLGSPGFNKFLEAMGKETRTLPDILGDAVIKRMAEKHKKTPAQVALRFLLQRGIAVIPKSVTAARLKQNIDVFNFELDQNDMKNLTKLEVGESARVCNIKTLFKGVDQQKEWPL